MRKRLTTGLLGIAIAVLLGYLGVCAYLYIDQRNILYHVSSGPQDGPPAGYADLNIAVPGAGTLRDWWAAPARPDLPTIIFFHGNASDRTQFASVGARFHRQGWGVVLASYRGYSGNPGKPSEAGLMADARATLATVKPRVGPIIVWGHSLGSGVAARMAAEGRADGLVLESPYTSVTDLAAAQYPYVPVRWLLIDRFDTRALLGRIKVPVLIFHSVDDPTIPYAMGQAVAERLGDRATLVTMNGVGHFPHHQDLTEAVTRWARTRGIGG